MVYCALLFVYLFRKNKLTLRKRFRCGPYILVLFWFSLLFAGEFFSQIVCGINPYRDLQYSGNGKECLGSISDIRDFNQCVKAQNKMNIVIKAYNHFLSKLDNFSTVPDKFKKFHTQYRNFLKETIQALQG